MHEAVLKSGEKVVVKIQRPNIGKVVETDIDILYKISDIIQEHFSSELINPKDIVSEFDKYTKGELDYVKEGKNLDRLRKNFANDSNVKIPKVYWKYSTSRLLTLDYIYGTRLSNFKVLKKSDSKETASSMQTRIQATY